YIDVEAKLSPATPEQDLEYIDLAVERLRKEIEENSDLIAWAKNTTDILENKQNGKLSALLTMEDARAVNNSLGNIDRFYKQGFQMIGILWNRENCFGFPN